MHACPDCHTTCDCDGAETVDDLAGFGCFHRGTNECLDVQLAEEAGGET